MEGMRRSWGPWTNVLLAIFWSAEGVWAALECERQRMAGRHIYSHPALWNHSINCASSFQWEWSTSRICCYDNYDRFYEHPYCCSSEMYKLVVAVGFICLFLLGTSFLLFFCWFYNLPHHILYLVTFRKFQLNDWLYKARNGPYVDPSFYAKEPFWSRGADAASQLPYPLRPMPPRIFYPAPPTNMKFRGWDLGGGDIPLFILASRQFHRNPYSARPQNRTSPALPLHLSSSSGNLAESAGAGSRRSSLGTLAENDGQSSGRGTSSHGGSAVGGNRGGGSGWRNNSSSQALTSTPEIHPNSLASALGATSYNSNYSNNAGGGYGQPSRPYDSETPFVIPLDDDEVASELREAIRLIDAKSEADGQSWTIAGDSLGTPSGTIFMTNASREVIRSEGSDNWSSSPPAITETGESYGNNSRGARRNSADDVEKLRREEQHYRAYQNQGHNVTPSTSSDRMVGVTRVRFGGKVSVQLLNQQLSHSLGLSLNNLPNIQVIGNFRRDGDGMETIAEDENDLPYDEEEMDYAQSLPSPQESRPTTSKKKISPPSILAVAVEETPRISSALDRIVTRARQEVPFVPSLPGAVPESPDEDGRSRRKVKLNRRNSAPVNF